MKKPTQLEWVFCLCKINTKCVKFMEFHVSNADDFKVNGKRVVINCNESGYQAAKKRARYLQQTKENSQKLEKLESDISDIKQMLSRLLGGENDCWGK